MTRPAALAAFLSELRNALARARPGPAHHGLAALEGGGFLDAVVTQNVDGLHQDAGSRRVVELHGSFGRQRCLVCGRRQTIDRPGLLEDLDRAIAGLRSSFVPGLASVLPRCVACGGPARPDFVAFGESVQDYEDAERLVRACRVLLVVGTSGEVYRAAGLPDEAPAAGARIIDVTEGGSLTVSDLSLVGTAGSILPVLAQVALNRSSGRGVG